VAVIGFFYTGLLVNGGPEIDSLVLDCYRLAKYFHISPFEFLRMPLGEVQKHMRWTSKLIAATKSDDDGD
jgi:hypothetical protein